MQRTREGSEGNMTRRQNEPLVLHLLFLRPKTAALLLLLLLLLLLSWSSLRVLVILLLVSVLTLQVQGKGKSVPLHSMKVYGGNRDEASLILNLSSKRRVVVHFMFRSLYSQKRTPVPTVGCADPRTGLDWPKKLLAVIVIRTPDPPVCRESQLLRYPDPISLASSSSSSSSS